MVFPQKAFSWFALANRQHTGLAESLKQQGAFWVQEKSCSRDALRSVWMKHYLQQIQFNTILTKNIYRNLKIPKRHAVASQTPDRLNGRLISYGNMMNFTRRTTTV